MDVTQNTKSILTLSKEGKNACFFCTVTYFLMHTGGGEAESSTP